MRETGRPPPSNASGITELACHLWKHGLEGFGSDATSVEREARLLFLHRPRQTWMPYQLPRDRTQQVAYNRSLQERFEATHRVPGPVPTDNTPRQRVLSDLKDLAALYSSGALTEEEFNLAKAKLLESDAESS